MPCTSKLAVLLICGTAASFVLRTSMPRSQAIVVAAKGKKGKKGA